MKTDKRMAAIMDGPPWLGREDYRAPRICPLVLHVVDEADEHLLPGLLAPADVLGGVRIGGIAAGIVEARLCAVYGSTLDRLGLLEAVAGLPVEVVAGDVEKHFLLPVGRHGDVFES